MSIRRNALGASAIRIGAIRRVRGRRSAKIGGNRAADISVVDRLQTHTSITIVGLLFVINSKAVDRSDHCVSFYNLGISIRINLHSVIRVVVTRIVGKDDNSENSLVSNHNQTSTMRTMRLVQKE